MLPSLARVGVGRVIAGAGASGLPPRARGVQRASHASAQCYRSLWDEFAQPPMALAQQTLTGRLVSDP